VAAPEDDQYDEHHRGTMVFSSFRVPQGGISDWWRIHPKESNVYNVIVYTIPLTALRCPRVPAAMHRLARPRADRQRRPCRAAAVVPACIPWMSSWA
jgi:hypothetical protein